MTRVSVNRTLSRLYWLLAIVLLLLLAAKFADDIPGLPPVVISVANQLYEFMRDMSLLIATGGVAYLSNIFQKRSKFVESLKEEWRNIVRTKSVLLGTCEKPYLATDDYLAALYKISETIDTMRIVYRNAGETGGLVGLYPFEPLHDMRRALQTLDPRLSAGRRVALAAAMFATGQVLTDVLVFSFSNLYPAYHGAYGISAVTDQQLAGVVMMVEQLLTLGTLVAVLLAPRIRRRHLDPVPA